MNGEAATNIEANDPTGRMIQRAALQRDEELREQLRKQREATNARVRVHFPCVTADSVATTVPKRDGKGQFTSTKPKPKSKSSGAKAEPQSMPSPISEAEHPPKSEGQGVAAVEPGNKAVEERSIYDEPAERIVKVTRDWRVGWEENVFEEDTLLKPENAHKYLERLPINERVRVVAERHERIGRVLHLIAKCIDESPGDAWPFIGELCMEFAQWDCEIGCLSGVVADDIVRMLKKETS